MARGGMYDQLGGGFHRYSTDANWIVPHFEQSSMDNPNQIATGIIEASLGDVGGCIMAFDLLCILIFANQVKAMAGRSYGIS
jgi:hypothetical protein